MTDYALAAAIVLAAALAWDVARRWLGKRSDASTLDELRAEVKALRERNDNQVKNALREVHELIKSHDQKVATAVAHLPAGRRQRVMGVR